MDWQGIEPELVNKRYGMTASQVRLFVLLLIRKQKITKIQ
jgi:hypothetical protein